MDGIFSRENPMIFHVCCDDHGSEWIMITVVGMNESLERGVTHGYLEVAVFSVHPFERDDDNASWLVVWNISYFPIYWE